MYLINLKFGGFCQQKKICKLWIKFNLCWLHKLLSSIGALSINICFLVQKNIFIAVSKMHKLWRALLRKGKTAYSLCLLGSYELMNLCQQCTVHPLHRWNVTPISSVSFHIRVQYTKIAFFETTSLQLRNNGFKKSKSWKVFVIDIVGRKIWF